MSSTAQWFHTEKCLAAVAPTLGHLMARIRPHVSCKIIDGQAWWNLLECAGKMPVTLAAFPFGLEVPLHDPELRVDFGVSLVGESHTSAHYQKIGNADNADRSTRALAWILDETERGDSMLRRVVGNKMLLEYDIDIAEEPNPSEPGIFLYPVDDVLAAGTQRIDELRTIHNALIYAGGWSEDAAEWKHIKRLYEVLSPNTLLKAFGTFPSRKRTMRIAVTGFKTASDVAAYLVQAGWPGNASVVSEIVAYFTDCKAFAHLGIHFDMTADGVGPGLGLSLFAQEKEWLKDINSWLPAINAIGEQNFARQDKLDELAQWSTGSATFMTDSGPMMLVRGIHHLKLSIVPDKVEQAKAYVFYLIMSANFKSESESA